MRPARALPFILILLLSSGAPAAAAEDSRESVDQETSKPVVRGSIVFKAYCALCHGERGDGTGRGAKIHARLHLAIKPGSPESYISVVREGGQSTGISPYMPPWKDELSAEQIADVVAYLGILHDSARRGEAVFKLNCMLCHGVHGDGNGRAGRLAHPPPADLTRSTKDDPYKVGIISSGGAAMGRSSTMPPWGKQLTETEIQDLVKYLKTLLVAPSAPQKIAPKGEQFK